MQASSPAIMENVETTSRDGRCVVFLAIQEELKAVERELGVHVVYAVESGSRAWGFESEDSDYDVRFVYARPAKDYLRLEGMRDTIEWCLQDDLDIVGWDVAKFLRLMRNSNPTVFEWLASTIVYREEPYFDLVRAIAPHCLDPAALAHHYLGIATKYRARFLKADKVTLKRYLYTIRSVLATRWAIERKTTPPMAFEELCAEMLEPELVHAVKDMVERKATGLEKDDHVLIPEVDAWVDRAMDDLKERVATLTSKSRMAWEEMNIIFFALLEATGDGVWLNEGDGEYNDDEEEGR